MKKKELLRRQDMNTKPNVYSVQFEYQDLCNRLLKIKNDQEKQPSALYRTFDSSLINNQYSAKVKKRKTINRVVSSSKNNPDIANLKSHKRNLTEQIYLSNPFSRNTYKISLRNHSGNKRLKHEKKPRINFMKIE